jgi:hypothetical protein
MNILLAQDLYDMRYHRQNSGHLKLSPFQFGKRGMSNQRSCFNAARQTLALVLFVTTLLLLTRRQCLAQNDGGFISTWLEMCNETQTDQPYWVTPLATVTPRLEQEYRFDALRENTAIKPGNGGAPLWNIDNGKGLEIIPELHTELLFNLPPYILISFTTILDRRPLR